MNENEKTEYTITVIYGNARMFETEPSDYSHATFVMDRLKADLSSENYRIFMKEITTESEIMKEVK